MKINSVFDKVFKKYGQVMVGYDFAELFEALSNTPIPNEGILYEPSVKVLEDCDVFSELKERCFGGLDIQLGFCNGVNDTLNCLEYHKSGECNIAKDNIVLLLGYQADIEDGRYDTKLVEAFHVPAGVGVEMFATTLHYAPCGYNPKEKYQVVCVLPKGTNTDKAQNIDENYIETKMCTAKNKWIMAHKDSNEAKQGAYVGLDGENLVYTIY